MRFLQLIHYKAVIENSKSSKESEGVVESE